MTQTNTNIFTLFSQTARVAAQHPAIISKERDAYRSCSFEHLYQQAVTLGNYFKSIGIEPHDKIAFILGNQPEYAVTFFAIMYVGAVAVPFDVQYSPTQVQQLLLHSESKILVISQKDHVRFKDELSVVDCIVIDSEQFVKQLARHNSVSRFEATQTDDVPAALFYTSGTTDAPKAVMLTHHNLLSNVDSIVQMKIARRDDRFISILPLHHTYSFTVTLLTPLLIGATIVYPSGLSSVELLGCIRDAQVTLFVGVPQIFSLLYRSIGERLRALPAGKRRIATVLGATAYWIRRQTRVNLNKRIFKDVHAAIGPSLRYLVSGGARLDPEVAAAFERWGFTILEGYGLTETSPVATFNPPGKPKIGSVGKPLPGVAIKIVDRDEHGIGEVAIKGPNVMLGYYNLSRQTQKVIHQGWFFTGDLGRIDTEGYLYLTGRKKELIVSSAGKNIYPEEVERHYAQSPFIKEICVLAVAARGFLKGVERLAAVVVINEDVFKANNETNIRNKIKWEIDNLSAQLPTYKRVTGFAVSKQPLPRTALGKIMRYKVAEMYAQLSAGERYSDEETPVEDVGSYSPAAQKILAYLQQTLKRPVRLNDHLELDLGLDSLGRVEVLLGLQEMAQVHLSDEEAMEFVTSNTVKELLDKLHAFLPTAAQVREEHVQMWRKVLHESPAAETTVRMHMRQGFFTKMLNYLALIFFRLIFFTGFRLKVEGAEHLRHLGPYLICPNHASYLDALVVFSSAPVKTTLNTFSVGYSVIFEHFLLKYAVGTGRIIPIDTANLLESLRACSFALRNGKNVCYFPEGQRSVDGTVKEFKKGVGILIKELQVPVVPVYLEGTFTAWPRLKKFPRFSPLRIRIGKMLAPEELCADIDPAADDEYAVIAQRLREAVVALAPSVKK